MKNRLHCIMCSTDTEDIRVNPHAWDGWVCTPKEICPRCMKKGERPVAVLVEAISQDRGKVIKTLTLLDIEQAGL